MYCKVHVCASANKRPVSGIAGQIPSSIRMLIHGKAPVPTFTKEKKNIGTSLVDDSSQITGGLARRPHVIM